LRNARARRARHPLRATRLPPGRRAIRPARQRRARPADEARASAWAKDELFVSGDTSPEYVPERERDRQVR